MKKQYLFYFLLSLLSLSLKAQTENFQTTILIHPDEHNLGCTLQSEEVRFYTSEQQLPQWMFNIQQFVSSADVQTYLGNITDAECSFSLHGLTVMHQLLNSNPGDTTNVQGELLFNGARIPVEAQLVKKISSQGPLTMIYFSIQASQIKAPIEGNIRFDLCIKTP